MWMSVQAAYLTTSCVSLQKTKTKTTDKAANGELYGREKGR